jgi:hypothetical protein
LSDFERHCQQHVSRTDASNKQPNKHFFWFDRYDFEERDSLRRAITRDELCSRPFEQRRWFSHNPAGWYDELVTRVHVSYADDVQPTGLNHPGLDCQFTLSGDVLGYQNNPVKYSLFDGTNANIRVLSSVGSWHYLVVQRTPGWGWQLNNADFVMRSIDEVGSSLSSAERLWKDLTSNIVMQERPPGVVSIFNWREIPDDEELQFHLPWRNSWRAPVGQN